MTITIPPITTIATIVWLIACIIWWIKVDPLNWRSQGDFPFGETVGCAALIFGWLVLTLLYAGFWIAHLLIVRGQ